MHGAAIGYYKKGKLTEKYFVLNWKSTREDSLGFEEHGLFIC
jgi:hypothetical protein